MYVYTCVSYSIFHLLIVSVLWILIFEQRMVIVLVYILVTINNSTVKSCLGGYADFSNAATMYGQQKEKSVRTKYAKNHWQQHSHNRIFDTGLHVNPKFALLRASPDGLVDCQECGQGCIEIKCPYTSREMIMFHYITHVHFYKIKKNTLMLF